MASGGARARSGPAPDPNALRRDRPGDQAEWTALPADGRPGDPPAWPLPRPINRERAVWAYLWSKPQAAAWEREGDDVMLVALYTRRWVEAEVRFSTAASTTIVRQLADELGITSSGMARRKWRLATDEIAERRTAVSRPSARDRLKVASGGDA